MKRANYFEHARIVHQVQYLGLLENVRVRQAGFAYRQEYHRFTERYKTLVPSKHRRGKTDQEICRNMINFLASALGLQDKEDVQFGKTKLFLKTPEVLTKAEELRKDRLGFAAAVIQQAWRNFKGRERLIRLRQMVTRFVNKSKQRRRDTVLRSVCALVYIVFAIPNNPDCHPYMPPPSTCVDHSKVTTSSTVA